MRFLTSRTIRDRGRRAVEPEKDLAYAMRHDEERRSGRAWEDSCLRRWPYDKAVRFTHGANCPDLCSFDVFAKDGIIVWKSHKTDNLTPYPDVPDYEPRGGSLTLSTAWHVAPCAWGIPLSVANASICGARPNPAGMPIT